MLPHVCNGFDWPASPWIPAWEDGNSHFTGCPSLEKPSTVKISWYICYCESKSLSGGFFFLILYRVFLYMKGIYKTYTCSHTSRISWSCCVSSNTAATITSVWLEGVNRSESRKRKKNWEGWLLCYCSVVLISKGKSRKLCVAQFVTKASPNMKRA